MATKRRPRACERAAQPDPGILLWLLRILVPLGGLRELKTSYDSQGTPGQSEDWVSNL
ncbi:MAG: hypothetical protein IKU14_03450 [Rhodocyclaceae bacterium]|nr:hypothetical protein [Rhodocyclaceae bacterium]